jgi:hypothetical protein
MVGMKTLILALFVLSLTACGSEKETAPVKADALNATSAAGSLVVIRFANSTCFVDDLSNTDFPTIAVESHRCVLIIPSGFDVNRVSIHSATGFPTANFDLYHENYRIVYPQLSNPNYMDFNSLVIESDIAIGFPAQVEGTLTLRIN